jgi:hypothetical protein
VPQLWRRHPAQRTRPVGAGSLRTGGSQAEEGQDGFACVKSDSDPFRRTTRDASAVSCPRPAHRLGRARAGALSMVTSFKAHLTTCPRSTFTASHRDTKRGIANPPGDRTRRRSAPTVSTPPLPRGRLAFRITPVGAKEMAARKSQAAHLPVLGRGSVVGRAILYLSFLGGQMREEHDEAPALVAGATADEGDDDWLPNISRMIANGRSTPAGGGIVRRDLRCGSWCIHDRWVVYLPSSSESRRHPQRHQVGLEVVDRGRLPTARATANSPPPTPAFPPLRFSG